MVFQNYALYPHMTVYENMAFGLKLRKTPKDEINRRVMEAAKFLILSICSKESLRRCPAASVSVLRWPCYCPKPEGIFDGRTSVKPGRKAQGSDENRNQQASSEA